MITVTITKPDKGSGVVILNKSDYTNKMNNILHDETKFERVGPALTCENTAAVESRLQKRLLELFKAKRIPEEVYRSIRPTGSQRPRMYGLPNTHKPKVPLHPILSMTDSAFHELSKWLTSLLQPVLDRYTVHCISDSFTLADYIRKLDGQIDSFMCSFDVTRGAGASKRQGGSFCKGHFQYCTSCLRLSLPQTLLSGRLRSNN